MRGRWRGLTLALGVVAACGGSDMAAEVMRDAGEVLADAGRWLSDAGTGAGGGVQAQTGAEVHEVACDALYQWNEPGGITQARLYAELDVRTDGLADARFVRCGALERVQGSCAAGTCTGRVDPAPYDCDTSPGVQVGPGKLRALCGAGTGTGGSVTWTYRFTRGRFVLTR